MKDGAPETVTEGTIQPELNEQEKKEEPVQTTTESDDEDFAADTQEMEEAAESDSESEDEENKANEDDVVEEDFAVEIKVTNKLHRINKINFKTGRTHPQDEVRADGPGLTGGRHRGQRERGQAGDALEDAARSR